MAVKSTLELLFMAQDGSAPRPLNYGEGAGWPGASCLNCTHELMQETRPACVKYFCYVRLRRICDDWQPGGRALRDPNDGSVFGWYRDDAEGEDEKAYLGSHALSEQE